MKNYSGIITKNTSYFFRGIAILMVIFSHYFEWGGAYVKSERVLSFIKALGDPGVWIFFFLSGYALYKGWGDKRTNRTYLWRRFKNMYFPYILIALPIAVYSGSLNTAKGAFRLITGADYWFIIVIILIYLAFYFIGKLPEYRTALMTLFIIDLSLYFKVMGYYEFWYSANWGFAVGLIFSKYEHKLPAFKKGFSVDIKDYLLCFLGKLSIYIYVLHSFIYMRLENIEVFREKIENWYIRLFIVIIVTVIVAYMVDFICKTLFRGIEKVFNKDKVEVTQK